MSSRCFRPASLIASATIVLQVGGQAAPSAAVGDEPEAVPDVVGERAVLLHLVELGDLDDRQRILLRVDDLGLQRGVDLAELQARRRGAERLEHRDAERAHRHADLEARPCPWRVSIGLLLVVIWRKPLSHIFSNACRPTLAMRGADVGAERAVHGLPDLIVVGEREAHGVDRRDRHQRRDDQRRRREEVDAAAAHLRQHVGVAAELVVREDLDLDAAVRLLRDPVGGFLRADVERMRERQVVAVLQREVGGARDARQAPAREAAGAIARACADGARRHGSWSSSECFGCALMV